MSKCENCIHYDRCDHYHIATDTGKYAYQNIDLEKRDDVEDICDDFKDKSLFVELPCEVGTPVYVIEFCHCYNSYEEQCRRRRTKASKWLSVTKLPSSHHTKCVKLFERPFKIEYLIRIGKTVFLTKEEAEKKLKEVQK